MTPQLTTDDVVTILAAVGDSWPAAIVLVTIVGGFVAVRALPKLKDITESLKVLKHEMRPNSGKTIRDAIDRLEKSQAEQTLMLAEHITEDRDWKSQAEDLLTRNEGPQP